MLFYLVKRVLKTRQDQTYGHNKIILFLVAKHASIFNIPRHTVSFVSFYQQTFSASFYLILLHLSIQIFTNL